MHNTTTPDTTPDRAIDPLLRVKTVSNVTTLSVSSIYARLRLGTFPKPIKLSDGLVAWRQSAITQWLNSLEQVHQDSWPSQPVGSTNQRQEAGA
jgi:prophage regulatory protein